MLPVAAILASRSTKIDDGTVARLLTTEQLLTSEPDCLVLEVVVMHVGVSMGWDMGEAKATSKRVRSAKASTTAALRPGDVSTD